MKNKSLIIPALRSSQPLQTAPPVVAHSLTLTLSLCLSVSAHTNREMYYIYPTFKKMSAIKKNGVQKYFTPSVHTVRTPGCQTRSPRITHASCSEQDSLQEHLYWRFTENPLDPSGKRAPRTLFILLSPILYPSLSYSGPMPLQNKHDRCR